MPQFKIVAFTPNAEKLIEEACRCCYQSYSKVTKDSHSALIRSVIRRGHLSVLEHASITVKITGSRVLTHELVRHRLASYSQESQRYVAYGDRHGVKKTKNYSAAIPQTIRGSKYEEKYLKLIDDCFNLYCEMLEEIPAEDARYILPNATESEIYFTVNLRELRHMFELRCSERAALEIRQVFVGLLVLCKEIFPNVFFDFVINHETYSARIER